MAKRRQERQGAPLHHHHDFDEHSYVYNPAVQLASAALRGDSPFQFDEEGLYHEAVAASNPLCAPAAGGAWSAAPGRAQPPRAVRRTQWVAGSPAQLEELAHHADAAVSHRQQASRDAFWVVSPAARGHGA